ncbi:hypothetical protein LCGC14_1725860, partial [marine sediment metagenome]
MKIKVLNPVHCQVDKKYVPIIKPCLKYRASYFRLGKKIKTRDGKERRVGGTAKYQDAYFIGKRSGQFLSGFLPRVIEYCKDKDISIQVIGREKLAPDVLIPTIPEITFKPFQKDLIIKASNRQRGVILAPTRSGKTIIAAGILSMFPKAKVLFLCHSITILKQTMTKFKKFGFDDVVFVGEGSKDLSGRIVVASIRSMVSIDIVDYENLFDIVMIDEIHHLSGKKTEYFRFMKTTNAVMRLGFTATMPTKEEAKLCIEGSLGPVIGELKVNEAIELGIIMKPYITLVSVPSVTSILELKKYKGDKGIYRKGIVENRPRNRLIMVKTSARVKDGKSVLILVKQTDHGDILKTLGESLFDLDITYIQGSTDSDVREKVRVAFDEKKIKVVICTVVWKEGIDIPSLDCVINAAGGKSEIATLQAIGRGLTKIEGKDETEIIDFLDPYKFLAQHAIMRLQIYVKMGWL